MLLYSGDFREGWSEKNDNTMVYTVSTEESYLQFRTRFTYFCHTWMENSVALC